MEQNAGAGHDDDLGLPFIFVPHGQPEPLEWMARHPGYIRIPATMVPRRASKSLHTPAITRVGLAIAASAGGLTQSLFGGVQASFTEAPAQITAPFSALGIFLSPATTGRPETDELSAEQPRLCQNDQGVATASPFAPLPQTGQGVGDDNRHASVGFDPRFSPYRSRPGGRIK